MTVANIGRRPMRWEGWGGLYKTRYRGKNGFVCLPRHLPKILAEKENRQEYTELDAEFDPDNIKKLHIWDGVDGEWKLLGGSYESCGSRQRRRVLLKSLMFESLCRLGYNNMLKSVLLVQELRRSEG